MAVSEKIKFIRQLKGWSQEHMAEMLSMSVNGYGSIERGETNVNLSRLEKIAEIFGIELSQLIGLNEKSIYYMSGANSTGQHHQENCVINFMEKNQKNVELQHEIEKLKLILEAKENEIKAKDTEITNLKKIISLFESMKL